VIEILAIVIAILVALEVFDRRRRERENALLPAVNRHLASRQRRAVPGARPD